MPIRDEAINVFMGLPGDGAAARADLQPRRRLLRARHRLQPHRGHRRGPRRHARAASPSRASSPRSRRTRSARAARALCFVRDPDGYRIELIERGPDAARAPHRRHRPRLELVPARRLHRGAADRGGSAPTRSTTACRIGGGSTRTGALTRRTDRARARHRSTLRALLPARDRASTTSAPSPTSAIRDATNRDEFVARARERRGLGDPRPRAATRRRATATSPRSTRRRWPTAPCSTSAAARCSSCASRGRHASDPGSWPLGAVRMTERFLPGEDAAQEAAQGAARPRRRGAGDVPAGSPTASRLVGIGGTVRNLAAAAQRAAGLPDLRRPGLRPRPPRRSTTLIERARGLPASERGDVPGIKPERGD